MERSSPAPSPNDHLAASLRGFGLVGLLAILIIFAGNFVFVPLSALLVLAWVHRSRTPWREIGYVWPAQWLRDLLSGVVGGATLKLLMKGIVMPLLGAPATNEAYQYLVGNTAALPGMVFTVFVVAGFGEETLFRGYLFERLGKLLGTTRVATIVIVLLSSALFGVAHYPEQGMPGVQQAVVTGLVFGTAFAMTRRVWPVMWAHVGFNLVAVAIIYFDLELKLAHLVFR